MRIVLTILFLFSAAYGQTNYHVKNGGSDAADGLSDATAWATLSKVNAMQSSLNPGDSILFKRGSVFNDSLFIQKSGNVGSPIVYGAYGTGVKPEITGFQSLTMTNAGGNIWTATATNSVKKQNTVLINDTIRGKARYPNGKSILTWVALPSNKTSIIIPHTATNYVGSEIAVRSVAWEWDVVKIASQNTGVTNDTLNFTSPLTYGGGGLSNAYFYQNQTSYLDSLNEWVYDSTSKLLSVYTTSAPIVKYSTIDTLVKLQNNSNITFDNLTLSGGNITNLVGYYFKNVTFQNCNIKNSGAYGALIFTNRNARFINDSITDNLSAGLWSGIDTSLTFNSNYVKNIAIYPGMGRSSVMDGISGCYTAFKNAGDSFSVIGNQFFNSGYIPIRFRGKLGLVQHNYIDSFCIALNDGGAIYTNQSAIDKSDTGSIINHNIIKHPSVGLPGDTYTDIVGLYLDDNTQYVTADSNYVEYNNKGAYVKGQTNTITNNTFISTTGAVGAVYATNTNPYHIISGNIFYNTVVGAFSISIPTTDVNDTIDYNYYLSPNDTTKINSIGGTFYSFSGFKTARSQYDTHSRYGYPSNVSSTIPTIYYNNSITDSTNHLPTGFWGDMKGGSYHGNTTIEPFGSRLIFPLKIVTPFSIGGLKFSQ
jgi:hypothetical protein